jgi:hypothetical protein
VIKFILCVENCNLDKWLKTVPLNRPHESNVTVSSQSCHSSPPESSTCACSQSVKETAATTSAEYYLRMYGSIILAVYILVLHTLEKKARHFHSVSFVTKHYQTIQ